MFPPPEAETNTNIIERRDFCPENLSTVVFDKKTAERHRLDLVLKGADLGFWDWDIKSGKVIFNRKWVEMLGFTLDTFKECINHWTDLIHPNDIVKVKRALKNHLAGRTAFYETEHRLKTKKGGWIWVLDRGKVVEWDENKKPLRATGIHRDITRRKRAEAALLLEVTKTRDLLEASRSINSGVSHEMRTPIQAIQSVLEIIKEDLTKTEAFPCNSPCPFRDMIRNDLLSYIEEALEANEYAISVLETLSSYAKSGTARDAEDIGVIYEILTVFKTLKMVEPFKSLTETQFVFSHDSNDCQIRANRTEFRQVIHNLCKNAIEAIDLYNYDPLIKIIVKQAGGFVSIRVVDNGCGINDSIASEIYKPYFTTKGKKGHNQGIGLSMVKSIVESDGGTISLNSKAGLTEFIITYPCIG